MTDGGKNLIGLLLLLWFFNHREVVTFQINTKP